MHLGSLGGRLRLWNGPNTHGGLTPQGVYDSGWYDSSNGQCDTAGRQFNTMAELQAYAASHGEVLQMATADEVRALCSRGPAVVVQLPAPPVIQPPIVQMHPRTPYQPMPPARGGPTRRPSAPTGVQVPTVITVPGGETVILADETETVVEEEFNYWPWVIGGTALLLFLRR